MESVDPNADIRSAIIASVITQIYKRNPYKAFSLVHLIEDTTLKSKIMGFLIQKCILPNKAKAISIAKTIPDFELRVLAFVSIAQVDGKKSLGHLISDMHD